MTARSEASIWPPHQASPLFLRSAAWHGSAVMRSDRPAGQNRATEFAPKLDWPLIEGVISHIVFSLAVFGRISVMSRASDCEWSHCIFPGLFRLPDNALSYLGFGNQMPAAPLIARRDETAPFSRVSSHPRNLCPCSKILTATSLLKGNAP